MNSSALQQDSLIGFKEVGQILGFHPRTIRRKCEKGELPKPIKIGKINKFFRSDILGYLKSLKEHGKI